MLLDSRLGNEAGLNATIVESDPVNSRQYVIFSKVNASAGQSRSRSLTDLRVIDDLYF